MQGYLVFFILICIVIVVGNILREKGFKNLYIKREVSKTKVKIGEKFTVKTTIRNEKKLPISFLYLEEICPNDIVFAGEMNTCEAGYKSVRTAFSIKGNEILKAYCDFKFNKRGVYFFKNTKVSVGDFFGTESDMREFDDLEEVVVYPKPLSFNDVTFNNNSIQGEYVVKRWIFKDPLFIKGIKEYVRGDRMKDIHWNSSAKMGNLMVKDYDFTAEKEVMFILSTECGTPYWSYIDSNSVEKCIDVTATLSKYIIEKGIAVGAITNSYVLGMSGMEKNEVKPCTKSLDGLYELLGRIDYTPKQALSELLYDINRRYKRDGIYILVCPYLNSDSIGALNSLVKIGVSIKIIDTSADGSIPAIKGIEKIVYDGGKK